MSSEDLKERIFRLNDTAFPWDESGQDFVAEIVGCIDEQAERIKELVAQVKNRELQIVKLESVERIRKLEADVQSANMCSHYRPDCPEHREIN